MTLFSKYNVSMIQIKSWLHDFHTQTSIAFIIQNMTALICFHTSMPGSMSSLRHGGESERAHLGTHLGALHDEVTSHLQLARHLLQPGGGDPGRGVVGVGLPHRLEQKTSLLDVTGGQEDAVTQETDESIDEACCVTLAIRPGIMRCYLNVLHYY